MIKMFSQIRFRVIDSSLDNNPDNMYGGIGKYDDGNLIFVICGCCGSIFEPDEVIVLERYEDWVDLTETIVGN